MAKDPKSGRDKNSAFEMPSDEELEALFGDDADMPDMSPGEMAAAAVSMLSPPMLASHTGSSFGPGFSRMLSTFVTFGSTGRP